jgi:hypothetical protein
MGAGTSNKGMKLKYLLRSFAQYSPLLIKTMKAQKPKSNDGNAANKIDQRHQEIS